MMVSDLGRDCQFDLLNLSYTNDARIIFIGFDDGIHPIGLEKMMGGKGFSAWAISSTDVHDVFGDSYVEGLSAFIGRLVEKCYSMNIDLPLCNIRMSDVEAAVEKNADALNELVRRTIESGGGPRDKYL